MLGGAGQSARYGGRTTLRPRPGRRADGEDRGQRTGNGLSYDQSRAKIVHPIQTTRRAKRANVYLDQAVKFCKGIPRWIGMDIEFSGPSDCLGDHLAMESA